MDFTSILQAITTVGFPIVMCIIMFKYIGDENKAHKEETKEFTEALNKNTIVLQQLCDKLNKEE